MFWVNMSTGHFVGGVGFLCVPFGSGVWSKGVWAPLGLLYILVMGAILLMVVVVRLLFLIKEPYGK